MASPEVESTLTSAQLRQYKKLQALGQEYADEYALVKAKENVGKTRAEVLEGKTPTTEAPAFKAPKVEQAPTYDVGTPTATSTEEEMGITFESPFFETESERLAREIAKPPEEGEVVPEETVPLEPAPVYLAPTPELAKAAPERIKAVTPLTERELGAPPTEEASRLQTLYAKFDDAEKAAYGKAKRELIKQGASLYEAEARAAQIVRGTISGPREILTAEKLAVESPELTSDYRVSPEFYQSEDVGLLSKIGEAIKPKPLLSPREVAIQKASERRGEEQRALLEDEVTQDLVAWRNGSKKFKGENYYVFFKDPVRGGIDQEKVDAWKKERFGELVKRTENDIKASLKRDLLDAEAAKGNIITPDNPSYKEIDTQAGEIANIWTSDVAPEIARPAETGLLSSAKAGLAWAMASNQELVWNPKDFSFDVKEVKGAPAFETPLAAGLRSVGGLIRGVTDPIAEFMSYEVDDKGKVLDTSDWNYTVHKQMQSAWDRIENGSASPTDYVIAYNPFGAIASTGRNIEGTAPQLSAKKFAGIPATLGVTEGTGYLEDWAFATATGRWTGTDLVEAPVIKEYYDRVGMPWVPWAAGLAVELLLPVSSLTAAGKGLGTAGELARISKLPRVATALEETGKFVATPVRITASTVGNRISAIRLNDALLEAAGAVKPTAAEKVGLFFKPAKLEEVVAEGVARNLANNIADNKVFPTNTKPFPEFNTLLYKGKTLNAIYETIDDVLSGARPTGINAPQQLLPELVTTTSNRLANAVYEEIATASRAGGVPVIGREVVFEELTKYVDAVATGKVPQRLSPVIADTLREVVSNKANLLAADLLPDVDRLFAETTFNNWLLITPTTAVKVKAWEKYGDQINAETRQLMLGNATDEEVAKALSDSDTVFLKPSSRRRIVEALNDYAIRTGKTPEYVKNMIGKVESGTLSIEEFNKVNDLVKSEVASRVFKGAAKAGEATLRPVDLVTTGRLSQRAAVPLVRRLNIARAFEDLGNAAFGRVLSKGLKQYSFETLRIPLTIPRANIDLFNRVEQLSAKINDLPAQAQSAWRKAIADGERPADILQREIDDAFNTRVVDGETLDYVSKGEFVENISSLVRRFFTITGEGKFFNDNYGVVINNIVDNMANSGKFEELTDAAGNAVGFKYRLDYQTLEDIFRGMQERFSPLQTKGLDTRVASKARDFLSRVISKEGIIDKEGVLSLLIASALDKKRLKLIDEFGEALAKDLPELVVGNRRVLDAEMLAFDAQKVTDTATTTYDGLKAEASRLGKPADKLIGEADAAGLPQYVAGRDASGAIVTSADEVLYGYTRDILKVTAAEIFKDVMTKTSADISKVISDVYQSVIRNASVQGAISINELETKIVDKFIEEYFNATASQQLLKRLKTAYPELNFGIQLPFPDGAVALDEVLLSEARAYYVDLIQKYINVNAFDLVSKLQTTGIPIDIVKGDITFSDIMIRAKQLGNTRVLTDETTFKILDSLTSNNVYVERGLEALAAKNKDAATWFGQELLNIIDDVKGRTIQGLLGGYLAPNTRFFGVNNFSAPLIAAVTNPTYVSTVVKAIPASFTTSVAEATRIVGAPRTIAAGALTGAVTGALTGGVKGAAIGAVTGATAGYTLNKAMRGGAYGFRDIAPIITPSGKVINTNEFNAILGRNKWRMSQIDFEFSDRLLAETVDVLKGSVRSADTTKATLQYLTTASRNRNFWNAIGSEADIVFRRAVFKEALARGVTEGEAANLARNTLLDYTAVSEAERKTVSRFILFYSFMRQSMAETMLAFLREPTENAIVRKVIIQRASADRAAKEYGLEMEDYQRSRLWVNMTSKNVAYDEKDVAFFGIDDPMLSSFNTFVGAFGLMNSYDYPNKTGADYVKAAVDWYASKRPEWSFLQDVYELSQKGKDGNYGLVSATDMAVLNEVGAVDDVARIYDIQPISNMELEKLKEKYGGTPTWLAGKPTYNGQYYKFGTEEGALGFMFSKYAANVVGFQRSIYDWAQVTAKANNIKNPELKRYKDGKWYLYGVGLETPMEAPDWMQIQYEIAQAQYRELQSLKQGGGQIKRITTEGE